ncbi:3-deoxy-D-manno-octulosonic acid kinase [Conservatibacter flavescens]|uniref:3-deoxy-D-manno-octulosonic acid kinase n=1 Tax=Conservatibacter flavescens TaxID=28161 RepID=A0A2M8S0R1_9PAST|nr:3-deoxy-D-manno-octulosonic acid kinase [Conservatibacter flavescens]PJG84694.1 3-deoxy-D-manno-octulosonic acid kinase [Conservatibacter flavescens]
MIEFQQNNQYFLFNTDSLPDIPEQWFDATFWQQQGRIIGSAKGRGTTWFIHTEDILGFNCALRHYYRGGLIGKINQDKYRFNQLEKTRSFAEFSLLNQLYLANFPVPKPIGARVKKTPFGFYSADILIEKIENAQDLTALLQHRSLSEKAWQHIGALIRQLHDLQIHHSDLNAHNILVQHNSVNEKYWLIDFDKCGQKSGNSWKQENLNRLHRSFQKEKTRMHIQFGEQDWAQLLTGYYA